MVLIALHWIKTTRRHTTPFAAFGATAHHTPPKGAPQNTKCKFKIVAYKTTQFFSFLFGLAACTRTHLIASSKTILSPLCVSAEHSKYL